jgi:hypothetical protein
LGNQEGKNRKKSCFDVTEAKTQEQVNSMNRLNHESSQQWRNAWQGKHKFPKGSYGTADQNVSKNGGQWKIVKKHDYLCLYITFMQFKNGLHTVTHDFEKKFFQIFPFGEPREKNRKKLNFQKVL